MIKLGEQIKHYRKLRGLTLFQLAQLSQVSVDYISKIERGKMDNVGFKTLSKISSALNVDVRDLLPSKKKFPSNI